MADRGPKKDSKRYKCRNEACERFGRIQYIQPWAGARCKFCGSENIEQVKSRVDEKPKPPDLGAADTTSPSATSAMPREAPAAPEEPPTEPPSSGSSNASETEVGEGSAAEDKVMEPPAYGVGAAPEPVPAAPVITPKNGDLVACKKCGWAVYWDDKYHRKSACQACGSTDIEIKMPVEGK